MPHALHWRNAFSGAQSHPDNGENMDANEGRTASSEQQSGATGTGAQGSQQEGGGAVAGNIGGTQGTGTVAGVTDQPELLKDGRTVVTTAGGRQQVRAPEGAKFLSKIEIIKADDSGYEDVEVPEWGGWVRVKALSAAERGAIENAQVTIKADGSQQWNGANMRELFAAYAIIDAQSGTRLFSNKEIGFLGQKSAAALDRVYESATRQARANRADMEKAAGNSENDLSGASAGGTGNE